MTPTAIQKLKNLLINEESYQQFPYLDTTGNLTIGIGRNLSDRGISNDEAFYLLNSDMNYFSDSLKRSLKFFNTLNENRQVVLIDMCFNLGLKGLLEFKNMMLALEAKDYDRVKKEMLDSKWAKQVGERAQFLSDIMQTGEM